LRHFVVLYFLCSSERADVAQPVERILGKDEVTSSILVISFGKSFRNEGFSLFYGIDDRGLYLREYPPEDSSSVSGEAMCFPMLFNANVLLISFVS
jgi:hypothetical protein